jgi:8-oxo-dGTP diphosphatase
MAPSAPQTEISARLLILSEDRVLLERFRGQDWYFLPGGQLSPGETVEQALRRGAAAQTGLDAHELEFVGCVEHVYPLGFDEVHELITVFAAPLPWGAQIISNDPELHLTSVDFDDLGDLDVRPVAVKDLIFDWVGDARPRWRTTLPAD